MLLASCCLAAPGSAQALITPPVTVDGPSSAITDFGGVAMASDGTGGLVYLKSVAGVPHVFASSFVDGQWSAPIRVDWNVPFEASEPRIAAGPKGELMVIWVAPAATVHGNLQYALFSSRLDGSGSGFGPALPVDPNVGRHPGVDPAIASTSPGKAIVAYRAITNAFTLIDPPTAAVQLRPGDVMAEIRVARLSGDRWSRLGAVNANVEASTRPPSPTNGPQVGTGLEGGAIVAWQEPDQSGAARIWMRRIFGTTPGPVLQASPSTWEGKPVTADADAFSLSVTPYTMGEIAFRIAATAGSPLAGRVLVNSLPPAFSPGAGTLSGPQLADGGAVPGGAGAPDLATVENSSRQATTRLAFLAGQRPRQLAGGASLSQLPARAGPPAQAGGAPVVAADPAGGGLLAYPALDPTGQPAVAVRQEFPSGAVQTGLLTGAQGGPVSELSIGPSGGGDGLVAFREGEPGRYEIVADRVGVPPAPFALRAPKGWVKPNAAKLRWEAAPSAVGGLTYAVLVDGRLVKRGLRRRRFRPGPAQLGNGVLRARVLATDGLGQQLLSGAAKLRVDGEPPVARLRLRHGSLSVRLSDPDSGLDRKSTAVSFGDGARERGGASFRHRYAASGRYRVLVRARDEVGNLLQRSYLVRVR